MYGIDGRVELPEEGSPPEGYRGSAPVRIGNDAAHQLQLDIYGELIDAIYLYNKYGRRSPTTPGRAARGSSSGCARTGTGRRGHLGDARRPAEVHLLAAHVLGRGRAGDPHRAPARLPADLVAGWRSRDEIYRQIMERGWNEKRRAFVQHDDGDVLDASVLLMPL